MPLRGVEALSAFMRNSSVDTHERNRLAAKHRRAKNRTGKRRAEPHRIPRRFRADARRRTGQYPRSYRRHSTRKFMRSSSARDFAQAVGISKSASARAVISIARNGKPKFCDWL